MRKRCLFALVLGAVLLLGFGTEAFAQHESRGRFVTRSGVAMGTLVQVRAYVSANLTPQQEEEVAVRAEAALSEIRRLESLMTTWKPDSEVSQVNANAGQKAVRVSPEVYDVISRAQGFSKLSLGAFDVSFYALRGLWFFDDDVQPVLPDKEEIRKRLPLIDYRAIELRPTDRTVRLLKKGMAMNLGGLGKGYAVDAAVRRLKAGGILAGSVQAGGDLAVFGKREGGPFWAGIRDPRSADPTDSFAVCQIQDHAFSTAGDYERAFVKDGKRYHHILDPRTGWPAKGARSVTIYAQDATTADGLDDIVLMVGKERGLALVETFPDAGAVIVDAQNRVTISRRLKPLCKILHAPTPGV